MQYEEQDKEELDDVDPSGDLESLDNLGIDDTPSHYGDDEYEIVDIENIEGKGKGRHPDHESLKARRALEDRLASKQLRKELDYLYDDDFMEEDEENKKD